MSGKPHALAVCLAMAGLGILATVARVWMRQSTPLPRWDLFICLGLAVAGLVGALVIVRRGPYPNSGGAGTRKYWWPDHHTGIISFGLCVWIIPVSLVSHAVISPSPQAWKMVDAGHTIRALEVEKVLSSEVVRSQKTSHYSSDVQVSVPFDRGDEPVEDSFASDSRAEIGDQVWVLYAPSSPALGAFVDGDRDALESQIGGPADTSMVVLELCWIVFFLVLFPLGRARTGPLTSIKVALRAGQLRSLSVTVVDVRAQADERPPRESTVGRLQPCVRMAGPDAGVLDLYVARIIDPASLSRCLAGSRARLYWRPSTDHLEYGASVGYAVLALGGRRYIMGWAGTADGSDMPEGSFVPAAEELPEGRDLRAIRTFPMWDPALHASGLYALLISLLAMATMTLGVGTFLTVVLSAVAFFSPLVARGIFSVLLTERLEKFLPNEERAGEPRQS